MNIHPLIVSIGGGFALVAMLGLFFEASCGADIRAVKACDATCARLGMEGIVVGRDVCECSEPLPPKCERGKRERCRP